ncbi:MAG: acetyl-CoA carboxylase carboxyltransferase subunit alpha [Chloroflexi bacterium]|nr:acetyl-CoA carboxylase carboxyltransferase subunit alpha [Chloroflexota bacterium]
MTDQLATTEAPSASPQASAGPPQIPPGPPPAPPVDRAELRARVWARVQLARNVRRPHTLELLGLMADDVVELHGDRTFGDDAAIVGGFATIEGQRIVFIGHQKGAEVEENIRRNFGMPHPEGYRKAMRLMALAERLGLPVVTFVDTPGASPDAASEERGQAEAIARSIMTMTALRVPVVTVITGEGGSGGALAVAVGDVVLALENAIYSVISPEGCASILWRTPEAAQDAAVAMRLTAADQLELGVVDEVIGEPEGGAHTDPEATARALREVIARHLAALVPQHADALLAARHDRYRRMGTVASAGPVRRPRRERKGVADRLRDLLVPGRRESAGQGSTTTETASDDVESTNAADAPLHEEG